MRNSLMLCCVVLLSVGCKPEFPSCENAEYIIDGICVINPELSKDLIELIINKVHEYNRYDIDSKSAVYEDIGVSISFDTSRVEELSENAVGITSTWSDHFRREVSIAIMNRVDLPNKTCWYQSFILIHEMFHLVWWVDMGITDSDHNILGAHLSESVERNAVDYQVYQQISGEIMRLCDEE